MSVLHGDGLTYLSYLHTECLRSNDETLELDFNYNINVHIYNIEYITLEVRRIEVLIVPCNYYVQSLFHFIFACKQFIMYFQNYMHFSYNK